MYKRRKVFSKIGEKTFSTTEFQTQKEFAAKKESAKKEESKKEKVAKAATIGGATVGLGAGAAGLGAEIGRKKVKRAIDKKMQEISKIKGYPNPLKSNARKVLTERQKLKLGALETSKGNLEKAEKILEKVSKKGTKASIAGVGASVAGAVAYKALKKKKDQKEFSDGEPEQKEFNSKAQKVLRRAFDKSIGKKISGANTLDNQVIGRKALRKLDGSGVNASINEKARVNGASATSDKLSNSADKYARGVKTRSLKDTEVSQKIHDHDHVYKPTSKVIKDAKQIMKKNK